VELGEGPDDVSVEPTTQDTVEEAVELGETFSPAYNTRHSGGSG